MSTLQVALIMGTDRVNVLKRLRNSVDENIED